MASSIKMNEMVTLFRKELELCGVKAGEKGASNECRPPART